MKFKQYIYVALVTVLCVGMAHAFGDIKEQGFSKNSVKGCYGFSFHGTLIENVIASPVVAVGRLCSDGKGHVSALTRTLHLPNEVLQQTATGTYYVNKNGTGEAVFDVKTSGVDSSQESFHFTITEKNRTLQFISGVFRGPGGVDVGIDVVVHGEARK